MRLTSAQVRGVAFSKSPMGKRGYRKDDVDAFLDVVEVELARLLEENADLRGQLAQCERQPLRGAIDIAAIPLEPASSPMGQPRLAGEQDCHHHAARVLNLARQTADRMISQARSEADAMLSQDRAYAEQLLRQAQATAEGVLSQATTRVETVLHDARTRADTVERRSRDKADKIASQQHEELRRHAEIIAALSADKTALANSLERLRAFESEHRTHLTQYRTHLTRFLHAQLRELDVQEPAESADPIRAQQALVAAGSGARLETSPP